MFDIVSQTRYNSGIENQKFVNLMAELKRDIVKYIRDRAKNNYDKGSECYICGTDLKLDFHHYYSLAPLIHNWMKKTGHDPKYILAIRDDFIEEHWAE